MTDNYSQGEYAGPLTERAMDYNGHEAIGIQIGDAAQDGSCLFVTIDKHMQLSVIPVIASSVRSYDTPEPPPLESSDEDLQSAGQALAAILNRLLENPVDTPETLEKISIAAANLALVWNEQNRRRAAEPVTEPDYAEDVR